jgi:hypothetical protein
MAGFSKIFVIGTEGGFMGSDGVNDIECQVLVGDSSRQWLEPHYFHNGIKQLGNLKVIVPPGPDDKDMLLDALIAFLPHHFRDCPSMSEVERAVIGLDRLDFDSGRDAIPKAWSTLREEARPRFSEMSIWQADLRPLD